MQRTPEAAARLVVAAGALAGAVVLILHARSFLPFMADDSFISFRYAERLLEGKGLTWNDGERVEGYSNLLWLLLVAGLSAVSPLDLIAAARALGLIGMLVSAGALLAFDPRPTAHDAIARVAAALALVLSAPVAVWAIGGLEAGLVAALLSLAVLGASRGDWKLPGIALGLLCLTRPDSAVLVGGIALGTWLSGGLRRESALLAARMCALPVFLTLAQLVFRRLYYGDWLPNSAYAKVSFTGVRLREGSLYLLAGIEAMPLLVLAPLAGAALLATRHRRPALLLLPGFLAWTAYVVVIGRDVFPAYRHLVPALVLACFLALAAAQALARTARRATAASAVLAGLLAVAFLPAHRDFNVERARLERWEWDGEIVGELFRKAFGEKQPLLAADPAGCLPFFSRLPSLDMLGLNDRFLARHPPPDFGRGMPGHELGNGAYVLSRKPDLVVFCTPLGSSRPCFRSGTEMSDSAWFRESYRLASLETLPPAAKSALVFVRVEGKLGIERAPDRIRVPALVLQGEGPLHHRLAPDGTLATAITDRAVGLRRLWMPAGTWVLSPIPRSDLRFRARAERGLAHAEGSGSLALALASAGWVELAAAASPGQRQELSELRLTLSP